MKARHIRRRGLALLLMGCTGAAVGQQGNLPPIFKDAPLELRVTRTVAELPPPTFLESLVFDAAGTGYVTSHLDGTVYRLARDGSLRKFAVAPGKIAGITLDMDGHLVLSGADAAGQAVIFRVAPSGAVSVVARLPEAEFLNGIVHDTGERFLVADSYKGLIWQVDLKTGAATVWLQHELLARVDDKNPTPGANGIKLDKQRVLVSNTARQLLLAVPRAGNGQTRKPTILHERLNVDDFVVDRDGSILAATHVYNSLIRIAPGGRVSVLAGADDGMVGSTAVAFGRAEQDRRHLYVSTNGGLFLPPPGGVQGGKVVRVSVDQAR